MDEEYGIDPMDIFFTDTIATSTVNVSVKTTREMGTQTNEATVVERRKSWEQLDRKYQSSIASQTMEYIKQQH